jgi:hypothetical protein
MTTKRLTLMLLGVALVIGMAGQAQAVRSTVTGNFNEGGRLSGILDIDSSPGCCINYVIDYTLTTSGGTDASGNAVSSFIYTSGNSNLRVNSSSQTYVFDTLSSPVIRQLRLIGYTPTPSNPGFYGISTISERYNYLYTTNSGISFNRTTTRSNSGIGPGSANIPEPASLLLFGTGLAGLGLWRYRKSMKG